VNVNRIVFSRSSNRLEETMRVSYDRKKRAASMRDDCAEAVSTTSKKALEDNSGAFAF
jgi:hypothetical protein